MATIAMSLLKTKIYLKKIKNLKMRKLIILLAAIFTVFTACEKSTTSIPIMPSPIETITTRIDVGGYELHTQTRGQGKHTIVFEAGAGDDSSVWTDSGIFEEIAKDNQAIIYNRAGYTLSDAATNDVPRDINQLAKELHKVITELAKKEKVILVGHSLGGPIIRAYTRDYPEKVEGLFFVDPSHADVENATNLQEMENELVPYLTSIGEFGLAKELEQLVENYNILINLPNLPILPITVLTSMKLVDEEDTAESNKNGSMPMLRLERRQLTSIILQQIALVMPFIQKTLI